MPGGGAVRGRAGFSDALEVALAGLMLTSLCTCRLNDAQLNEADKAKLREVVKVHDTQVKFGQFCDPAASGASVALRAACRAEFLAEILGLANLIPQASQFVIGIPHHNDGQDKAQLWDVVRSIASTKMHYMPLISKFLDEPLAGLERLKFADAFPNLPPPPAGWRPILRRVGSGCRRSSSDSARRPIL